LKIINWNVGRPATSKIQLIQKELNERNAEIVVLTETNSSIVPEGDYYASASITLPKVFDGVIYKSGESRVTVWSKYEIKKTHQTCDPFTNVCVEINTPAGLLTFYATIIGVFGGRGERFDTDLQQQTVDFNTLLSGKSACIIGDYNVTFSGFVYPSHASRQLLQTTFRKLSLNNLTGTIADCVDHIAISEAYLGNQSFQIETWNLDKRLSDHIGTSVVIS
jgi:hypothetical protein